MIKGLQSAAVIVAFVSVIAYMQNKDIEADNHAAYVKELERVVNRCTNRGDNAIWIGDELYFCGAARTGIKL